MMDVTFNGTAPLRLSLWRRSKIQMDVTFNGTEITTVMDAAEALALSDILKRLADELS